MKDLQEKVLAAVQLLATVGEPDEVGAIFRSATNEEFINLCRDLSAITYLTSSLMELGVTERGLNVAQYRLLAMMAEELALGINATKAAKSGPTN